MALPMVETCSTLVAGGLNTLALEAISSQVATDTLNDVLTWLEATLAVKCAECNQGTDRILK